MLRVFKRIRQRLHDMATISRLLSGAEQLANENGEELVGAEHVLLAALRLPDDSARRVFERLGCDPDVLPAAIKQQYRDALSGVGVDATMLEEEEDPPAPIPARIRFDSKPSAKKLMRELYQVHDKATPLRSAHVVAAAAMMQRGVLVRALKAMDVDLKRLHEVAMIELSLAS